MNMYYRKSAVLVLILMNGIKVICIVSGDRAQPCVTHVSSANNKNFRGGQRTRLQ